MRKTDSSCIKMYEKTPPSCFYLNWLQRYGIKYIIFMNSTAAIFDLITLEVAKKIPPTFVLITIAYQCRIKRKFTFNKHLTRNLFLQHKSLHYKLRGKTTYNPLRSPQGLSRQYLRVAWRMQRLTWSAS